MYTNILLSTDGSDVAREGVKHGIALAKALNAKVTVITVTEPLPVDYGGGHASGWIPRPRMSVCLTSGGSVTSDYRGGQRSRTRMPWRNV